MKGWNVRNFILPLVLCLFQAADAAELNGKVRDADGAPVDFASIRIYSTDSVLVAGVVCDETGSYSVRDASGMTPRSHRSRLRTAIRLHLTLFCSLMKTLWER